MKQSFPNTICGATNNDEQEQKKKKAKLKIKCFLMHKKNRKKL